MSRAQNPSSSKVNSKSLNEVMVTNQVLIAKETVETEALVLNTVNQFTTNMPSLPEQHIEQGLPSDNLAWSVLLIAMT